MALITLLHGPNLNLLGQREPEIYGTATLDDYVAFTTEAAKEFGHEIDAYQTNHEGGLVDAIHNARQHVERRSSSILAPSRTTRGAFTTRSPRSVDQLSKCTSRIPTPASRGDTPVSIAPVATGSIIGFGMQGYRLAVEAVAAKLSLP